MRTVTAALVTLLLPLGARGQEAVPDRGGHGGATVVAHGAELSVLHERFGQNLVLRLGPFHLPAHDHTMQLSPPWVLTVPVGGWVTSFRTRVVDGEGRPLPSGILHHINLVRPDRRELFMPLMQRLVAASQETGRIGLPFPFGVPVEEGDSIMVVAMLHNPTGRELDVTVEARIHYDTPAWLDRMSVQPFFLDVQPPPVTAAFDLPPGRSTFTWEGSPAVDARVLGMGGHLHAFAEEVRLEELREGGEPRVLWRARPITGDGGEIQAVPRKTFILRGGLELSSRRTYRLVAVYDNPTGRTIPNGGMAEIGGIVRASGAWPAADRTSARYAADYRYFTGYDLAVSSPASGHQHDR